MCVRWIKPEQKKGDMNNSILYRTVGDVCCRFYSNSQFNVMVSDALLDNRSDSNLLSFS